MMEPIIKESGFSCIPVAQMSVEELETELEMLNIAIEIFKGKELVEHMNLTVDMYKARAKDIENEIFERRVLV